jgi:hypothetical protein
MKRLLPLLLATAMTGCVASRLAQSVSSGSTDSSVSTGSDHPGSVPVLLGLDPVRQDLKLSSLQCTLLDSLRAQYKSRSKQIIAIGMADEDAGIRANWDLKSLSKQFNERALNVLSSSQQDRLRQIERQMLGGNLLTSPSEQQLLGLSAQQQQQLASISQSSKAQVASLNAQSASGKLSPFWADIKRHQLQSSTSNQMLSVLTEKQKKHWLVLSGQKMGLPKFSDPNARTQSIFEGY